jgi:hypothetical protein
LGVAVLGFGLGLTCASAAAAATEPSSVTPLSADTVAPTPVPDKDAEVLCRRIEVTGSHLSKERVCMTRKQWEK